MQRGSVFAVVLVLVLAGAIALGVFYLQYSTQTKSRAEEKVALVPSPSPKLEVYNDEVSGLNFTLPAGFRVKSETEEEYFKRAFGNIRKNFTGYILYPPADFAGAVYVLKETEENLDEADLTIWTFKNPKDLSAKQFYEEYWYYPFVWGDFTSRREQVAPESIEIIGGREGQYGVVEYRPGKPKFIYLPLKEKDLMLQLHFPLDNPTSEGILKSVKFN